MKPMLLKKILKKGNRKGATLVELLLTIALLAIISSVFIQILVDSMGLRLTASDYARANKIANVYAEAIKQYDKAPETLYEAIENYEASGLRVQATWTDRTADVVPATQPLSQLDSSVLPLPDMVLRIGNEMTLTPSQGATSSLSLSGIKDNALHVWVTSSSSTLNAYQLRYETTGEVTKDLGTVGKEATIRLYAHASLNESMTLYVHDETGGTTHFQVFDDINDYLNIVDVGTNNQTSVKSGYLTNTEATVFSNQHYAVQIQIFKNSEKLTDLLTEVTVE